MSATKSKKPTTIKAIIFDLGKVLLDYDLEMIAHEMSRRSGKNPDEIMDKIFEIYMAHSLDTGKSPVRLFINDVIEYLDIDLSFEEFRTIWCDIFWVNHEMVYFSQQLRKDYPIYILSNVCELHHEHIENTFTVSDWADEVFVSYKEKLIKPDAKIYKQVLEKIGCMPQESILIDDREENVEGAAKLGMNTILFKNLGQFKEELSKILKK